MDRLHATTLLNVYIGNTENWTYKKQSANPDWNNDMLKCLETIRHFSVALNLTGQSVIHSTTSKILGSTRKFLVWPGIPCSQAAKNITMTFTMTHVLLWAALARVCHSGGEIKTSEEKDRKLVGSQYRTHLLILLWLTTLAEDKVESARARFLPHKPHTHSYPNKFHCVH